MTRAVVTIRRNEDRERIVRWARHVEPGTIVEFRKAGRSLDQNALLWSRLGEISEQVIWYGQKLDSTDWKDLLTASLRHARVVPGLEPGSFVPLGMRTSTMTKAEMTMLLDLISAFGAQQGVVFKDEIAGAGVNASTVSAGVPPKPADTTISKEGE